MASALSFSTPSTMFHQPAARRPISFSSQPRLSLYPLLNEELIKNKRLSLPPASREPSHVRRRQRADTNEYIKAIVPRNEIDDPNEMARLITLVLQPRSHHKRESAYLSLLETLNDSPNFKIPFPILPPNNKRRSLISPSIPVVYTKEEWKEVMEEVKTLFGKRHFKKCAARCKHLLDEIHNQSQRQPIYTTYLAFYAAVSLEQIARSLHNSSDSKLSFFRDSLVYYQKSKSNISSTSFVIPRKPTRRRRSSPTKSISSSNHSSLESLFSQFSLTGSECSVPDKHASLQYNHRRNTSSVSSAIMKPAPLRIQKKVSFSDTLPEFMTRQVQKPNDDNWDLINSFPMPPSPSNCPSLIDSEESEDEVVDTRGRENVTAIQRFQLHLKTFGELLDWHINAINVQISLLEEAAKKQNDVLCAAGELEEMKSPVDEGAKKAGLKKRIARRRGENWERKKFDPTRYQELCAQALSEADGTLAC